jgi:ribonucleoside-triphosphate reductase
VITDKFGQVVYSINQPAAARGYQAVFWNIAYFDKNYFDGIFHEFIFPDDTEPQWESVSWLQKRFMKWFNAERLRKPLTFPVETMNLLDDGKSYVDNEWFNFAAEMYSEGHSFFTYRSGSVDSLASCCRLRNELQDNTFSFTLGAGGVSTGSKGVITININRLVQDATKSGRDISEAVTEQVEKVHCYLKAFNEIMKDNFNARLLPVYDAGYISLDKQFVTIGVNGFVEGAEFLGIPISPNDEYFNYCEKILKPIYELNKAERTDELMFNTEFVPAENLGVKNAKWDREDGYFVPRDCYNSYFYIVEDESTNIVDKIILHGEKLTKYLDGGSAAHLNLNEHLTKEQYKVLMKDAIKTGCSYFTFNIPNTICNDCDHISKHRMDHCEKCGSTNIDYLTRIIGYLKRVSAFSEARQKEEKKRYYE